MRRPQSKRYKGSRAWNGTDARRQHGLAATADGVLPPCGEPRNGPGLVNIQENHGKSPFIADFPMKNCNFSIVFLYVYQRVSLGFVDVQFRGI